jgi:hypothetical protein
MMRATPDHRRPRYRAMIAAGMAFGLAIILSGCGSSGEDLGVEGDFPPHFAETLEKANPNIFKRKSRTKSKGKLVDHYNEVSLGDRFLIMRREAAKLKEQAR